MSKNIIKDKNIKIMNKKKTIKRMRGGTRRFKKWFKLPQRWSKKKQLQQTKVINTHVYPPSLNQYFKEHRINMPKPNRYRPVHPSLFERRPNQSPPGVRFSDGIPSESHTENIPRHQIKSSIHSGNPFAGHTSNENNNDYFIAEMEHPEYMHEINPAPPAPIVADTNELFAQLQEHNAVKSWGRAPLNPDLETELNNMFHDVETELNKPEFKRKNHTKIKPPLPSLQLKLPRFGPKRSTAGGGSRTLKKKKSKTRKNKNKNNTRNKKK